MNITIECDYVKHHHWMSFASWYSIKKNIPEANVSIFSKRGTDKYNLFDWTYILKVPFSYTKKKSDLIISPTTMSVRHYLNNNIVNVKTDFFTTFVNYEEGIGRFVTSRWINKIESPFYRNLIYFHDSKMTLNELKVLSIWESLFPLYAEIQRRLDEKI